MQNIRFIVQAGLLVESVEMGPHIPVEDDLNAKTMLSERKVIQFTKVIRLCVILIVYLHLLHVLVIGYEQFKKYYHCFNVNFTIIKIIIFNYKLAPSTTTTDLCFSRADDFCTWNSSYSHTILLV